MEAANSVLGSIFDNLDPNQLANSTQPLQRVLADQVFRAVQGIDSTAIGDPVTVSDIQNRLGRSLVNLSDAERAIPILTASLETRQKLLGNAAAETIQTRVNLGEALHEKGNLVECRKFVEETLKLSQASLGPSSPESLHSMNNLGAILLDQGELPKAVEVLEEALKLRRESLGTENKETITTMNNLAMGLLAAVGKGAQALAMHEELSPLTEKVLGASHPNTISSLNNLAMAKLQAGQRAEATEMFEQVLRRRRDLLGASISKRLEV